MLAAGTVIVRSTMKLRSRMGERTAGAMIFTSGLKAIALQCTGGLEANDDRSFNVSTRVTALTAASSAIRDGLAAGEAAAKGDENPDGRAASPGPRTPRGPEARWRPHRSDGFLRFPNQKEPTIR